MLARFHNYCTGEILSASKPVVKSSAIFKLINYFRSIVECPLAAHVLSCKMTDSTLLLTTDYPQETVQVLFAGQSMWIQHTFSVRSFLTLSLR